MAVHSTSGDFWQTTARSTIRERCKAIFNQELLSDVKFVVQDSRRGRKSKSIPAHKFVLAISSPVFYAMFYGELAETLDCVEISDCEYESLLELFRFIYSDQMNLNSNNVMQLLYLAKKYMLPSLADKCSAFLQVNVDASNVFHVLPDAQKYEEKDLVDHCWEVIEKETYEAVRSDGFVNIERSVLEELVENESLNIKEVKLFKAVNCWVGKECEKQGLAAEGPVKRRILGERIVKGIRFPVMEQKVFADTVLDCDILTKKECVDMMKYFSSLLNTPVGFATVKRAGGVALVTRFRALNKGWSCDSKHPDFMILKVDKTIKLHALRFFGSERRSYAVTLKLKIFKGIDLANITGQFRSKLMCIEAGDYHGFEIVFDPPIDCEPNNQYIFTAKINGPPCWYGEGGVPEVVHSGVKFMFATSKAASMYGAQSSIKLGQFSEFAFTVV